MIELNELGTNIEWKTTIKGRKWNFLFPKTLYRWNYNEHHILSNEPKEQNEWNEQNLKNELNQPK